MMSLPHCCLNRNTRYDHRKRSAARSGERERFLGKDHRLRRVRPVRPRGRVLLDICDRRRTSSALSPHAPTSWPISPQRGADVRAADFDEPGGPGGAMAGGEQAAADLHHHGRQRPRQHGNAIDAAKAAGVKHIVYTSIIDGGNPDHPAVEQHDHYRHRTAARGIRRGLHASFATASIPKPLPPPWRSPRWPPGHKPDNCGDGRIAFVSRDDCVATAVGVLTQDGHENTDDRRDRAGTADRADAMAMVSEMAGKPIELMPVDRRGDVRIFRFARRRAQGGRRRCPTARSLGERRHGDLRPGDPRGLFRRESDDCRAHHRQASRARCAPCLEQYQDVWPQ